MTRNQGLDDRRRDVVAVQRRFERRLVPARPGVKPVALQNAVVERGIGVPVVGVDLVERSIGGGAILLIAIGLEDRAVLTVAEGDAIAGAQCDRRRLHVGRRQCGVTVVRHAARATGIRQQPLTLLVEDVFLLVKEGFDGESVKRERGTGLHPLTNGFERDRQ